MTTPAASVTVRAPTLMVTSWDSAYCPARFTARWTDLHGAPVLQGLASLPATVTVRVTAAWAGVAASVSPRDAHSAVAEVSASARAPRGRPLRGLRWVLACSDMERPPRARDGCERRHPARV